jgi:hypothetical protein
MSLTEVIWHVCWSDRQIRRSSCLPLISQISTILSHDRESRAVAQLKSGGANEDVEFDSFTGDQDNAFWGNLLNLVLNNSHIVLC